LAPQLVEAVQKQLPPEQMLPVAHCVDDVQVMLQVWMLTPDVRHVPGLHTPAVEPQRGLQKPVPVTRRQ
jgi:hypothetical protein